MAYNLHAQCPVGDSCFSPIQHRKIIASGLLAHPPAGESFEPPRPVGVKAAAPRRIPRHCSICGCQRAPRKSGRARWARWRRPAAHPDRAAVDAVANGALRACCRIKRSIRCGPHDTPSASMSCHTPWRHRFDRWRGSWREPLRQTAHRSGR
jgi:hypothetical protein